MDGVGLAASIVQLISATAKVINYVEDVKNADKEQVEFLEEAKVMLDLLTRLKTKAEQEAISQPLLAQLSQATQDGPIHLLQKQMENIAEKLQKQKGLKEIARKIMWPRTKGKIGNLLDQMERAKSMINIALLDKLGYNLLSFCICLY
jgi:hypothetical protein